MPNPGTTDSTGTTNRIWSHVRTWTAKQAQHLWVILWSSRGNLILFYKSYFDPLILILSNWSTVMGLHLWRVNKVATQCNSWKASISVPETMPHCREVRDSLYCVFTTKWTNKNRNKSCFIWPPYILLAQLQIVCWTLGKHSSQSHYLLLHNTLQTQNSHWDLSQTQKEHFWGRVSNLPFALKSNF